MLPIHLVCFCLLTAVWAHYVDVPHGRLQGHRLLSRKDREIFSFQGIPYAKPPVGELRFQPPQPPVPWTGVLKATQVGPDCIQKPFLPLPSAPEIEGEEDCLYLNVYTPQLPTGRNTTELLPVMFWIHGGGWEGGSGSDNLYGPQYLLDSEILLVTINYRLGALGFFSTGDEVCPGNNGFKDQVAALRWVRDNIAAFGGNPDSVTIFGQSAGSGSVHYLMLSEASRGLFHRAISESGTVTCIWALTENNSVKKNGDQIAADVGCPTTSSSEMISCLRNVDAEKIVRHTPGAIGEKGEINILFGPVVESAVGEGDEAFISKTTMETILTTPGQYLVPWMAGINSAESGIIVARMFESQDVIRQVNDELEEFIVNALLSFSNETQTEKMKTAKQIRKFYFGDKPVNKDSKKALVEMLSDALFGVGTNSAVKLHSTAGATVYYYYFDYRGKNSNSEIFGNTTEDYGVTHLDEMLYLFPEDNYLFPNSTKIAKDDEMVDTLTTIWTNFAITGNPTPQASNSVQWPPVSSPEVMEYGHIDSTGLHVERNLLKDRYKLLSSIAPTSADDVNG